MKNKFNLLLLSLVLCLSMAMFVSAGLTTPQPNDFIRDSAYNVTVNTSCACNWTNYSLIVTDLTGLSQNFTKVYANVSNSTQTQSNFSFYFNASGLQDGNDYNFTVILWNFTSSEQYSNRSVIIDFTRPDTPLALTSGQIKNKTFVLQGNVNASRTLSCTVAWLGPFPTSTSPSITRESGTNATCKMDISNANKGSYGYIITASDGTNQSVSAATYFTVDVSGGSAVTSGGVPLQIARQQQVVNESKANIFLLLGGAVALIVIMITLVIIYLNRKK